MIAIRHAGRKRMAACAGLALIATVAVMACGCGNPGEGTVHVGPELRAKRLRPPGYGTNKVEAVGTKSRSGKDSRPK